MMPSMRKASRSKMLSSFGAVFSLVTDASSYMGFEASDYRFSGSSNSRFKYADLFVFDAELCYSKVDIRDFEATDFLSRY